MLRPGNGSSQSATIPRVAPRRLQQSPFLPKVLLGAGRRLFDGLGTDHIELDLVRALEAPGVLHLRYRVRR